MPMIESTPGSASCISSVYANASLPVDMAVLSRIDERFLRLAPPPLAAARCSPVVLLAPKHQRLLSSRLLSQLICAVQERFL